MRPSSPLRLILGLVLPLVSSAVGFAQAPAAKPASERGDSQLRLVQPVNLPDAVTSFGAARLGHWVYAYGGHVGTAHEHSSENLVGSFCRFPASGEGALELLPEGQPLQGTALVAAAGRLYRIGGLDARNAPSEEEQLHSVASVSVFDPELGLWEDFPPLPEPRSSHDAIAVGSKIFVVGGWRLSGGTKGSWHAGGYVCDLEAATPTWEPLPDLPFTRRAVALAAWGNSVALLGGIRDRKTTPAVHLLKPGAAAWVAAPDLPGQAFGCAAVGVGEHLYATVMDGRLLRLRPDAGAWELVSNLSQPRFFHRLVAAGAGEALLALGGTGSFGHTRSVERLPLNPHQPVLMTVRRVQHPGLARERSASLLLGDTLLLCGGNARTAKERFAPENLRSEVLAVDLAALEARLVGSLPAARQSAMIASVGTGRLPRAVLLGGMGRDAEAGPGSLVRAQRDATRISLRDGKIVAMPGLPGARTAGQALTYQRQLWVFGGTDFVPEPGGRGRSEPVLSVLRMSLDQPQEGFADAGVPLPAPRRSFGAAVLGKRAYLVGGLGKGFTAAPGMAAFDFEDRSWSNLPTPRAWVAPQVATIGERLYVACGGTMLGMRFTQDRSVWSWSLEEGWRCVLEELPFETRHVALHARRDRLLFVAMPEPGQLTLHEWKPAQAPLIRGQSFGH